MILWDWDPLSWIPKICQRAGRNFTNEEWKQYFPGKEYHKPCEEFPRHSSYYEAIAKQLLFDSNGSERIQNALDGVRHEMESDSAIHDPTIASKNLVEEVVANMIKAMPPTEPQEILDFIKEAEVNQLVLDPFLRDFVFLNNLCWNGSIRGYATQLIEYCEQAVDLSPSDPNFHDTRGLARALTGNYAGAIEDFQFFVAHETRVEGVSRISQREQWIVELKAGRNPFTVEVLEELMSQ